MIVWALGTHGIREVYWQIFTGNITLRDHA